MMHIRRSVYLVLILLTVGLRLVPFVLSRFGVPIEPEATTYPWNFSPILPLCLFGGAAFADRRLAFAVPAAVYAIGDIGIWALTGELTLAVYRYQPVVYASAALVVATGFIARRHPAWRKVAGAGLLASAGFFVVSNFGVWALGEGTVYPLTPQGLVECYVRAIPFFRNTLVSMAIFLPVLFSRVTLRQPAQALDRLAAQRG